MGSVASYGVKKVFIDSAALNYDRLVVFEWENGDCKGIGTQEHDSHLR